VRGTTLEPAGFTYAEEFMDPAAEDAPLAYPSSLMPRSAYIVTDDARAHWQHRIPATKDERYSLTLRSLTAA
jgi:hypothetical protein